ncbi:MAG: PQQ-binding-like beta-propeller repeat protein [Rubripirellula sp.]
MKRDLYSVAAIIALFALSGCGKKNPVREISVVDSGIALAEPNTTLAESDWNQWRGPQLNGIAPAQELVTSWDDEANVVWRSDIAGRGHGSPIVIADSVYLATCIDDQDTQQLISYDRTSGKHRWTTAIHDAGLPPKGDIHKKATNANGTIACDGQRLFIAMLNSEAIIASALDLKGKILWQQEIGKFVSRFGYAPSPVLYKSLVIFAADNGGGGYITAVDAATGTIAWRIARGNGNSYSSPTVATVGGRDQLLISGGDAVCSYDPASGEQLWKTPCLSESTCSTVVATNKLIFASGGYPESGVVCLSADGKLNWKNDTKVYEPSLLVAGDKLIAVNDGGIGFCWQADTGQQHWKKRLGGNFSASPILVDQKVYVPNLSGDTFVFTPSDQYQLIAKNKLGDDCYASPAVSNGQIFLRVGVGTEGDRNEQLVCVGSSPESL